MSIAAAAIWDGYSPLRRTYRRFRPRWMSQLTPSGRTAARFVAMYGTRVRHGPFTGMEYPAAAVGRANFLAAKLLGSYECEIHRSLEGVIASSPPQIVDIGSAEGYYSVGLALRTPPSVQILAYELDPGGRSLSEEMANINAVAGRVTLGGFCDTATLGGAIVEGAVLVCDCEGYERELLRPERVPQLRSATILVELHPMIEAGIEEDIRSRFQGTHQIDVIRMQRRDASAWSDLDALNERQAFLAISEGWRSAEAWALPAFQRCWAFMVPRVLMAPTRPS